LFIKYESRIRNLAAKTILPTYLKHILNFNRLLNRLKGNLILKKKDRYTTERPRPRNSTEMTRSRFAEATIGTHSEPHL